MLSVLGKLHTSLSLTNQLVYGNGWSGKTCYILPPKNVSLWWFPFFFFKYFIHSLRENLVLTDSSWTSVSSVSWDISIHITGLLSFLTKHTFPAVVPLITVFLPLKCSPLSLSMSKSHSLEYNVKVPICQWHRTGGHLSTSAATILICFLPGIFHSYEHTETWADHSFYRCLDPHIWYSKIGRHRVLWKVCAINTLQLIPTTCQNPTIRDEGSKLEAW